MTVAMPRIQLVMNKGHFNCIICEGVKISGGQTTSLGRYSRMLKQLLCDHSLVVVDKGAQGSGENFIQVDLTGRHNYA